MYRTNAVYCNALQHHVIRCDHECYNKLYYEMDKKSVYVLKYDVIKALIQYTNHQYEYNFLLNGKLILLCK